jgi:hypothetical protein
MQLSAQFRITSYCLHLSIDFSTLLCVTSSPSLTLPWQWSGSYFCIDLLVPEEGDEC